MKEKYSDKNYIPSALPHNRKAQFSDIIKHRFMLMVLCGIFIFIGFLPVIFIFSFSSYISDSNIFTELAKSYTSNPSDISFLYFWTINVLYLIMIPLLMLAFVFLTGGLRIYRLLGWGDGIFFFHDFFKGIKLNFKNGLIFGFLLGFYIFLTKFIGGAITLYFMPNVGLGIEIFLKGVFFLFILPISVIALFMSTYYTDKFKDLIVNSFYIYLSRFFVFFLLSILVLIVYIFPFIGNYYLILISIVLLMLFIFPIYILIWNQNVLSSFDKLVDDSKTKLKGLYDPSNFQKDEDEERTIMLF